MKHIEIINALRPLEEHLNAIQDDLISSFGGDEGHDIGDAGSILELVCNTSIRKAYEPQPHDSYSCTTAQDFIAEYGRDNVRDFDERAFDHAVVELTHMSNEDYLELHKEYHA
jgi:hypothetical protein